MDKLKGFARRAVAQLGLQHVELPTTENPGYSPVDRDEAKDSERLLASPSPSGESDLTACEKNRASCDCVCHQKGRLLLPPPPRRLMAARINLFASLFWLLGVLLIILAFRVDRSTPANGTFGWSPVVDDGAVEYVEYTFPFFDIDNGQDQWNNKPSYELDVRWFESYNWLTRVPNKNAANMPNGTIKIPGDEENSVVWLGVFHELHCLNVFRKLVWFEYYSVHADLVAGRSNMRNHLVHCLDALRKGVMCHADITPIPFWSKPEFKNSEITPMFKIPHTCRSYDRILDWAKENVVDKFECPDEDICGTLNAITMTVAPGDPQPTYWPDPNPAPAEVYTEDKEDLLQCGKSVLDWC